MTVLSYFNSPTYVGEPASLPASYSLCTLQVLNGLLPPSQYASTVWVSEFNFKVTFEATLKTFEQTPLTDTENRALPLSLIVTESIIFTDV
uniref:Uncharacterized protein n=1 Tax=Siphoviridae sp. ctxMM9 TaxID=2827973 RepID=A0A8S5T5Y0_9CAUD|nr:MAG TPA: hypothetical protein [Siphoviridae sp. ctxMM9]